MKDELVHWDKIVNFTPKQLEAYKAIYKYKFLLYGGARGGGKSRWGRWSLASFHLYWAGKGVTNLTTGIFSRTYTDLQERQIAKISAEFPEWFGTLKESREHGLAYYINPKYGGGAITLKNLDDPAKYKSAEFAAIFVDELTENQIDIFNMLLGSLRWANLKHTPFFAGSNPDGIGNEWVYSYFIDHQYPPEMQNMSDQFHFVQSKPGDNPYLDDNYYRMLNSLPPDLKKAWVDGEWNLFKGLAFKSFKKETHVIEPFYIPEHWARIIGIDSGYAAPFCCLFGARNPDNGRIYIYKEIYKTELTDQQQARIILDYSDPEERRAVKYADPAMWVRKTQREVTSSAKIYAENGLFLKKGNNDRIQGKRQVDRLLQPLADGEPGIVFFENCTNIIKQMSHLVYDKSNPEDVDTRAEDHCLIAETLIKTERGDIPIIKVKAGDKVMTREGYCKVLSSWMESPSSKVIRVSFSNGSYLIGTGNHPVWVADKGWTRLDTLRYGDIINVWNNEAKQSQHVEKRLSSISTQGNNVAPVYVLGLCEETDQAVYNLEVEGINEFYANGILVHNSYDALKYLLTSVGDYKKQTPITQTVSPFAKLTRL